MHDLSGQDAILFIANFQPFKTLPVLRGGHAVRPVVIGMTGVKGMTPRRVGRGDEHSLDALRPLRGSEAEALSVGLHRARQPVPSTMTQSVSSNTSEGVDMMRAVWSSSVMSRLAK